MRTIEPFVGQDVHPVPLIPMGRYILPGTIGVISGWGITVNYVWICDYIRLHINIRLQSEGGLPIILQKLNLSIWEQRECFVKWYEEITTK